MKFCAIRRAWRWYKARSTEIALQDINRALDQMEGDHRALLQYREELRRELAHLRAEWLATMKPGKRRIFEVA